MDELMSLAKTNQPIAETTAVTAPGELRGHLDAVHNGRVFGWVWYPSRPQHRLEVAVFIGDSSIAKVVADKPRIDLRRNGIGDGGYAFDVELPESATEPGADLSVVATHPDGGADLVLRIRPDAERAMEVTFAAAFGTALDRLETAIVAQRRVQNEHTGALRELTGAEGILRADVRAVHDGQDAIVARLGELEVFLVRFDTAMGLFQERLDTFAKLKSGAPTAHILALTGAVAFIAGIAVMAGLRL